MGRFEQMADKVHKVMGDPKNIRNIGIIAHIDHGKSTLSDNLISGAGLMSEELAGKELITDAYELEQERGITIFASNVSMVYDFEGKTYLVNLIDTPGHIDFGGNVTRALRAVDGAIVVVCAVEGTMPQTETVLRQALKERVKPVLFINKTDRLINELQLNQEQMQDRLTKIIAKVNKFIERYAPDEYKQSWQVGVEKGTVAIGSAYHNWAISFPYMKKRGITFKDVYQHCKDNTQKELAKKMPAYEILLDIITKHLPNPVEAQKYRIMRIWGGDPNSEIGQQMMNCDKNGKVALMITGIEIDPQAGEIATARLYSGKVQKGTKLQLINCGKEATVQQVNLYMSDTRIQIPDAVAGNIAGLVGVKDAFVGDTACEEKIEPFESIKHYSEPVITKSVESKNPKDLPRLIEALRQYGKEDPTVHVQINMETGEHLISGMGELHLEIVEHVLKNDKHVDIVTSKPIVVYRETVGGSGPEVEGKSPNRHNKFLMTAEPIPDEIYNAIIAGEIPSGKPKGKEMIEKCIEKGMDRDMAKKIWQIYNGNMFIDITRGIQNLHEVKELVLQAFEEAMDAGPMAREKCTKILIKLTDATLHEDAVHRGPSQTIPAVKKAILAAVLLGNATLLEPKQKLFISAPQEYMGAISNDIQGRRGQVIEINQEEDLLTVVSKVPVAEMFGFAAGIRSATQGRALWSTEYLGYEKLSKDLQSQVIKQIRERKGLKAELPKPEDLLN